MKKRVSKKPKKPSEARQSNSGPKKPPVPIENSDFLPAVGIGVSAGRLDFPEKS